MYNSAVIYSSLRQIYKLYLEEYIRHFCFLYSFLYLYKQIKIKGEVMNKVKYIEINSKDNAILIPINKIESVVLNKKQKKL